MTFETTITGNGWDVEIIRDGATFSAIKGYRDSSGFNAVRNLGAFKTRAGAERAARRAIA